MYSKFRDYFCILFQTDPMKDLLRHYDGEAAAAERQTLSADLVTQDTQGIRDLIKVLLEELGIRLTCPTVYVLFFCDTIL